MPDHDVIIIGAGAGGPVVAKELAEQGLKVLHLEAGAWHDRLERDLTHSEADMTNPVSGVFRWGPSDRDQGPWVRRMVGPGLITQVAGVGGTTLHYFANSPRAFPLAVERGRWPVSYRSLIPYYERVESILPVIRDPRLPTKDAWALYGADKFGLKEIIGPDVTRAGWRPQPNAVLPPGYAGPGTGCTQCGHCYEGCMHPHHVPVAQRAKRGTNVSYVPLATRHRNYRLVSNAFATKIVTKEVDGKTTAAGVQWRDVVTGETNEATARVVVLAAGCIESPRLWLNSELPNTNDAVGRYLTIHWFDFVTGIFDHAIHPYVGQNSQSRVDFPGLGMLETVGLNPGKEAFGAYTFSQSWGADDNSADQPWDTRGHLVGDALKTAMDGYDRSLNFLVVTDDQRHPENRVMLADDWPADENGKVPKIQYTPTTRSDQRRDQLAINAAEILRAAGARTVHRADWPPLYLHMQSSMRMGRKPETSVVDKNQEAWEVQRLYVCDASSLPDSLGGPNPTLTTFAFATRTAEHIAVHEFGRDPFVKSGDGVTSPAGFPKKN
ncbi:MAG TPA: GMC family oxidoreductase [Actinomycetota bacterium]|nr:GMC family oxidoreductase [Actinomycetota bacterium]